jgi:DNA repair exonuclease SbcCD ATPase subunit
LDANEVVERHAEEHLGVDLVTLSNLAAIREGGVYRDEVEGVARLPDTLSEALGLGRARRVCSELQTLKRRLDRSGDEIRKRSRLPTEHRHELQRKIQQFDEQIRAQDARIGEAEEELAALRQQFKMRQEWNRYEEARREYERQLMATRQEAEELGVRVDTLNDMQGKLREELSSLAEMQSSKEREVGALESGLQQLEQGRALLSDSMEICPTCLRPLSDAAIQAAGAHRERETARLRARLEEARADLSSYEERSSHLRRLFEATKLPGPQPPGE